MTTPKPSNHTIAYIRDEVLRHNRYEGSKLGALRFLMREYDKLWAKYRSVVNPVEYTVIRHDEHDQQPE